ncbi:MAG: hypothetical protein AAGC55_28415, partial [Myxococcota bacterium]
MQTTPSKSVLLGDTVALSAAGSCVADGTLAYEWTITSPDSDLADTAQPGLDAETIEIYPTTAGEYTVTLVISDGLGNSAARETVAFAARGWVPLTVDAEDKDADDINDLTVGGGFLWLATRSAAYRSSLSTLATTPYELVNDVYGGSGLSTNSRAIYYDDAVQEVWFGGKDEVFKIDLSAEAPDSVAYPVDPGGDVREIVQGAKGLLVASQQGVSRALDRMKFVPEITHDAHAVGRVGDSEWAGIKDPSEESDSDLYDLTTGETFSFFPDDDKIRSLVEVPGDPAAELWIGTDGDGIIRFDPVNKTDLDVFTAPDDLPDDKARELFVEPSGAHAGDVWVATQSGVARYKHDRQQWLILDMTGAVER